MPKRGFVRQSMGWVMDKITIDTNVLVRLLVDGDEGQRDAAVEVLDAAEVVIIPTGVFMETIWVMMSVYKLSRDHVLATLRGIIASIPKIQVRTDEIEAGFAMMVQGGDFADGVHAYMGRKQGGAVFVTFDRRAAKILSDQSKAVCLLVGRRPEAEYKDKAE